MVKEIGDVQRFLASNILFRELDESSLASLSNTVQIAFAKSGEKLEFLNGDAATPGLILVRSGSLEIKTFDNQLSDKLSTGDFLLPDKLENTANVVALEDCLYYELPKSEINKVLINSEELSLPKGRSANTRLSKDKNTLLFDIYGHESVRTHMCSPAICTGPNTTVQQAAKLMSQKKISSLLITEANELLGILTDRDLRTRVLATALPLDSPVSKVMTPGPARIEIDRRLHEAQLIMMAEDIHHLPVMNKTETVGIISLSDVIKANNSEPLSLIHSIKNSKDIETLKHSAVNLPDLVANLIERDTRSVEIGEIITSFTDALTRRLLTLGQEKLGEAPINFAWLAFGSQARQEQMMGSDQDNALVLERDPNKNETNYFTELANYVNEGLHFCGIPLCPGEIMARNPKWRMTLQQWKQCFQRWIEQPSPEALLHASIFFDMRHITGKKILVERLQAYVLDKARANTIFLAHMSGNSLQHTPPLGFFKTFVLERDGDHNKSLDLKKRGTIPIVDIARNYSLSQGINEVNTIARLHALQHIGALSKELSASLIDAHEFIAGIRLQAQGSEYREGKKVDNFLDPKAISPLLRHQLKEAFRLVEEAQNAMSNRLHAGLS